MNEADTGDEAMLFPKTPGERLREARESQGLLLSEIASRTRVPIRHLEAIENDDYSGLPSPTYSVGFAKAYARAIGCDEVAIGRDVRGQTDATGRRSPEYQPYELADPSRLPPRGLAMAGAIAAVLVVLAAALWLGSDWFRAGPAPSVVTAPQVTTPVTEPVTPSTATPTPAAGGQVTLTATDVVWLRVYDATGKTLRETELQPGERYEVPPDADRPMINVGRPDKLNVTVNGSAVPPLGTGERAIKDVEISAAALIARSRSQPSVSPTAVPNAVPTPSPSPSATSSQAVTPRARPARDAAPSTSRSETREANISAADEVAGNAASPAP